MRKLFPIGLIALVSMIASAIRANAPQQGKDPLRLVQTIPLPNVKGRMDHLGVDIKGKRVFSIPGQSKPQGIFYSTDFKRLFVANGTDGTCKIYSGGKFTLIDSLSLGTNPNHV